MRAAIGNQGQLRSQIVGHSNSARFFFFFFCRFEARTNLGWTLLCHSISLSLFLCSARNLDRLWLRDYLQLALYRKAKSKHSPVECLWMVAGLSSLTQPQPRLIGPWGRVRLCTCCKLSNRCAQVKRELCV